MQNKDKSPKNVAKFDDFNEFRSSYIQNLLDVARNFVLLQCLKIIVKANREIISYARILYTSYACKTW